MKESDLYWLSGLLEGEGSFIKGPPSTPNMITISVQMTDEDVIGRVADLFGVKYHRYEAKKSHWKPTYQCMVRGLRAADMMRQLRPLMGMRRQTQIDAALDSYIERRHGDSSRKLTDDQALSIFNSPNTYSALARQYGVNRVVVRRIKQKTGWKHIHSN